MATAATGWKCTHDIEVVSENETTKKIKVICYWQNDGWNYDVNGISAWVYCGGQSYKVKDGSWVDSTAGNYVAVSCGSYTFTVNKTHSAQSLSCYAKITAASSYVSGTKSSAATTTSVAAKTKYTVSYNANGGSGAPSAQTKWYGEALAISTTKPTRTGYTFKGWSLTASGSVYYESGAACYQNKSLTLYAVWQANTYTIKYDANGGSGAPSAQSKAYGTTLKLSTVKPTRADYNFKGWATTASGSVAYAAGGDYTANAAATLYAVWELSYTKPRINNLVIERCDSEELPSDEGTYLHIKFDWSTDEDVLGVEIEWKLPSDSEWNTSGDLSTAGDTSGSVDTVIGEGTLSADSSYLVRINVTDYSGSSDILKIVEQSSSIAYKAHPPKSVGGAEIFETLFPLKMTGGFNCNELITSDGTGVNLDEFKTPGFHMSVDKAVSSYNGVPAGMSGTFTLEVLSAGAEGQVMQRITYCSKSIPKEYVRHFYGGSWGAWLEKFPVVLFNGSSNGTITLKESCSRFKVIEVYFTDNNDKDGGFTRVFDPCGKTLSLSIIEAGSGVTTYFRRTSYTVSSDGTQIVPNLETAGFVKLVSATPSHTTGANYIKITGVLGYHEFNM